MNLGLSRFPAWVGDALIAILVVVTSFISRPGPPAPPGRFDFVPVFVVLALVALPLRRRLPITALIGATALYALATLSGVPAVGIGIAAIFCAYTVGAATTRLATLATAGSAAALVVVLSFTVSEFGVVNPSVFQIAAGLAVAAALGDSSRSHREFLRAATERAERAEQTREAEAQKRVAEERLRIAQDLHDTVAHQISVISLNAGVATSTLDGNPDKARTALSAIRTSARSVLTEIGDLLRYLRGDDGAAATPPQPGLSDIHGLVSRLVAAGLSVDTHFEGDLERVPSTVGRVVYRVVQEGLTNAQKHGSAHRADVRVAADDQQVIVEISNPVSGERHAQPDAYHGGFGLTGVRERVSSVGGTVRVERGRHAFTLAATIPLRRKDRP